MSKLKVMTILGTRPEIIRLSECIKLFDKVFSHILVHTGQNYDYELYDVFFENLNLRKPDYYLNCVGETLGQTIGNIIASSYDVIKKENPDAILILGDTNSALSAISAKRLKVPIFHMEAGNRCFDENVPEEINRRILDHISDINLPYTENSRRYLLSEGIRKEHIFVTGSPMTEVLYKNFENIEKSDILNRLNLKKGQYIVVSCHREENIDIKEHFHSLMNAIRDIDKIYNVPIVYSVHPRSRAQIKREGIKFSDNVIISKPFGFFDYCKLQKESMVVLSDSGTLSEESAILKFRGVLIRTSTERPEVIDKGSIVIGGIKTKDIVQSINLATSLPYPGTKPQDYEDINVSEKVARIIQSYTKIVNKFVWHKE